MRNTISDYYVEQGFRSVSVDFRIDDVTKTEKKVVFLIDEGDKIKIAAITFRATRSSRPGSCRNAMKKTKVDMIWRVFSDEHDVQPGQLRGRRREPQGALSIEGLQGRRGQGPDLDVYVKNPKADPKKIKRAVRITIPIVEGDQYFVNEIRIVRVDQSGKPVEDTGRRWSFRRR